MRLLLLFGLALGATLAQEVPSVNDVYVSPRSVGAEVERHAAEPSYVRFEFRWSDSRGKSYSGEVVQLLPQGDEAVAIRASVAELGEAGGTLFFDGTRAYVEDWSTKRTTALEAGDHRLALLDALELGAWNESDWKAVPGRPGERHRAEGDRHLYLQRDAEGRPSELRVVAGTGDGEIRKSRLEIAAYAPAEASALTFQPRN